MTVDWPSDVNKKVIRNGTSWNDTVGFITDETRSGKQKRRMAYAQSKRTFTVVFHFNLTEYALFKAWFKDTCRQGFYTFSFPVVDASGTDEAFYRFTQDGIPSYTNTGGDIIEATMTWEEV